MGAAKAKDDRGTGPSPGPWTIVGADGRALAIWDAKARDVVSENRGPMRQSDARLIAAAPELLEALECVVGLFRHDSPDGIPAEVDAARIAIAKARGKS